MVTNGPLVIHVKKPNVKKLSIKLKALTRATDALKAFPKVSYLLKRK